MTTTAKVEFGVQREGHTHITWPDEDGEIAMHGGYATALCDPERADELQTRLTDRLPNGWRLYRRELVTTDPVEIIKPITVPTGIGAVVRARITETEREIIAVRSDRDSAPWFITEWGWATDGTLTVLEVLSEGVEV